MQYRMTKYGWSCATGCYDNPEKRSEYLTAKQARARVNRLPDTTRHFWSVGKYTEGDFPELVDSINADALHDGWID